MPLPTIPSGNVASATASTGYNVANSLRFENSSSQQLTRSIGSSPTNTKKGTFSYWIKRTKLSTNDVIVSNEVGSSSERAYISFNTSDYWRTVDENGIVLATNAVFRDVSAWYHFVLTLDSTLGTTTDRVKLFINGTRYTDFQSSSYFNNGFPNQDIDFDLFTGGQTNKHHIGNIHGGSSYLDGYLAEVCYCDGQTLDASSFGEFSEDSPNIWMPKDVSGLTFGNNGYYLDFEDSSALGNSSNSNNFGTVTNLAATDQAVDTCTNNFCTMNPLTKTSATLSEGNLKQATAGNSSVATFGVSAGKWYFEQKLLGGNNEAHLGFALEGAGIFSGAVTGSTVRGAGYVSLYSFDGKIYNEGSATSSFGTFSANDIVGFALDVDNGNLYLYQNGSVLNSGSAVVSGKTGKTWFPFGNFDAGNVTGIEHNFGGARTFTISSAVADGNGFGAFEFSPGSYLALCSKNLGSDGG